MIVCSCNVLSEGEVRACLGPGPGCPRTAAQVYQCLGCSPKCGRCARTIRSILDQALGEVQRGDVHGGCASKCGSACPITAHGDHDHGDRGHGDLAHGDHQNADRLHGELTVAMSTLTMSAA